MSKFWKVMAEAKGDTAEIELAGQICSNRPVDFWTGEKLEGDFIALDEFKAELKALEGKKNVTIKLNSLGGEVFAGKAIYDELKALKAYKTVKIMGVSASASTVVMLAGDKIVANEGDLFMIHEAKCPVIDYCDAESAQRVANMLTACNKAMAELYAKKTGRGEQEILNAMHAEKWLTARQAMDYGLIDEVITDGQQVKLSASADGKLYVGASVYDLHGLTIPETIRKMLPVMSEQNSSAKAVEDNTPAGSGEKSDKGGIAMETEKKIETVEALESAYPELVKAVREEAVKAERKRIQEIEQVEKSFVLDKETITNAKFGDEAVDARDLAFINAQAQAKIGEGELEKLKRDSQASNANSVVANSTDRGETKATADQKMCADILSALDKEFL